jgi:hypothetical protein
MFGGRTTRALGVSLVLLVAVAVLWPAMAGAGGNGHGGSSCPGYAEGPTIEMLDNCFKGTSHFVEPNSTITVKNSGQLPHSLTAIDGSIDTGTLEPREIRDGQDG